ncbi:MAG: hypothetical protein CMN28_02160 [Salinisphaeraceae bacterium]|nr:hypothetical protein [Salinisphaeraceae bacterium]
MQSTSPSVNLVFDRFKPDGGTERLALNTVEALSGHSIRIAVCAREWRGPMRDNIEFIRCRPLPFGRAWRLRRFVADALPQLRARGGLVQAHIMFPGADIYRADGGAHAQWLTQRRRIQSAARQAYDIATPYHRTKLAMEAEMLSHPDLRYVICNSEMVRADIRRHYPGCQAELVLVEPGIDLDHFRVVDADARRHAARKALDLEADATVLLFIGTGFERKGLVTAIAALAEWGEHRAQLVIIGRDRDRWRYSKLARQMGVHGQLRFVGPVDDVRPWLHAGDALIHPALYEPFGLVVVEAMAAGLPVLSSPTTGAARAMVREQQTGWLIDALDVHGYAKALRGLTSRSSQQIASQRMACEKAATPYGLQRMSIDLMQIYRQCLLPTPKAP